jgi:four helix bundle protein
MFDHERLEVYQVSIDFVVIANDVVENLPRGRGKLSDQLSRASLSIPLNVAEGGGLFMKGEKQRSYRIARGSAMECAAILDVCIRLELAPENICMQAKEMLLRIVSMLTKLIQSFQS